MSDRKDSVPTVPVPAESMGTAAGYLVRRRGGEFGPIHPLDRARRCGIGRVSTNLIVISDDGCSRNHAEVYWANDRWMIHDLGSLNGTRVNGRKIDKAWSLEPNDSITLGNTE